MIFEYTHKEPGLWRGWFKNGQSVEFTKDKHGWKFGAGFHYHGDEDRDGKAHRLLFLRFWKWTLVIPLGHTTKDWENVDGGPQWSFYLSNEFGIKLHWNKTYKMWEWPWSWHVIDYQYMTKDGRWKTLKGPYDYIDDGDSYKEDFDYTYVCEDGEVQETIATVGRMRHILCYNIFKWFKWPRFIEESIDIQFSNGIGEINYKWKGGCTGCFYDLRKNESAEECLRRMESERKF